MVLTYENKRALQILKMTTELTEQNSRMEMALLEAQEFLRGLPNEQGAEMLATINAALKP